MKSQDLNMNAQATSKIVSPTDIAEEERRRSAAEIRRRAFQVCIERVGIDCSDLHDWLQAERDLREKHKQTGKELKRSEMRTETMFSCRRWPDDQACGDRRVEGDQDRAKQR